MSKETARVVNAFVTEWLILPPAAAWLFMLAVGVVHGSWIPAVPTIGWWPCLAVVFLVRSALWACTRDGGNDDD